MSIALYRKYRPQKFGDVTNQNHIKITLQNELETGKLAHAYLFCGPRGTGKTTLARLLSKAANCKDLQKGGEPCNKCESCNEIMESKAMDIIEIDAASHTGVDNVRDNIINNARFTPAKSKYKVFIIDEVHMLSTPAFNALLKTLEEPPKHVIFVLATTEIHKVPVTIISRCQRFDFKKIVLPELVDRLRWIVGQEGVKVDEKILEAIAKNSGGCVRDAESLLEQVLSLGDKHIKYEQAELIIPQSNFESYFNLYKYLLTKDTKSAIELVNILVAEGGDLQHYFNGFIDFVRRSMIYLITKKTDELVRDMDEKLVEKVIDLVKDKPVNQLSFMIDVLLKTKELFKQSYIPQLPFEVAIIEITEGTFNNAEVVMAPQPIIPQKPEITVSTEIKPDVSAKDNVHEEDVVTKEQVRDTSAVKSIDNLSIDSSATTEVQVENPKANLSSDASVEVSAVESSNDEIPDVKREVVKNGSGLSLTFNQVISRWPAIVNAVTASNYTLGMSLSVAKPVKLEGKTLFVAFLFDLQKSRVESQGNIQVISEVIEKEFGASLDLSLLVDANLKLNDITSEAPVENIKIEQNEEIKDPVDQAINAFGGSVVDKM